MAWDTDRREVEVEVEVEMEVEVEVYRADSSSFRSSVRSHWSCVESSRDDERAGGRGEDDRADEREGTEWREWKEGREGREGGPLWHRGDELDPIGDPKGETLP